jgi:hypothetical protein
LCEVALVDEKSQGLHPWDNREELMEFVELRKLLKEAEVEHVTEAVRLVFLARDVPKVLVGLVMPPILGIPQDPCTAGGILEEVGVILECLREAYASGRGSWD